MGGGSTLGKSSALASVRLPFSPYQPYPICNQILCRLKYTRFLSGTPCWLQNDHKGEIGTNTKKLPKVTKIRKVSDDLLGSFN